MLRLLIIKRLYLLRLSLTGFILLYFLVRYLWWFIFSTQFRLINNLIICYFIFIAIIDSPVFFIKILIYVLRTQLCYTCKEFFFFFINVMQCQSAWDVIKWSIQLDPPRDETTTVEEDRGRSRARLFCPLSSYVSLSCLPFRSFSFFLADWDVNPHPSTSRHITFLPTASTYLPNYWSSRKKKEGNLSVRAMRILRSASIYGLRNVLSSFSLVRLFTVELWMKIIVCRDAHDFYCWKIAEILAITRECLNLSSYNIRYL